MPLLVGIQAAPQQRWVPALQQQGFHLVDLTCVNVVVSVSNPTDSWICLSRFTAKSLARSIHVPHMVKVLIAVAVDVAVALTVVVYPAFTSGTRVQQRL